MYSCQPYWAAVLLLITSATARPQITERAVSTAVLTSITTTTAGPSIIESIRESTFSPIIKPSINTTLDTNGHTTKPPPSFTSVPGNVTLTATHASANTTVTTTRATAISTTDVRFGVENVKAVTTGIFGAISTDAPPAIFPIHSDHPVKRVGIVDKDVPVETNKFYANLFLDTRDWTVWTMPYMVRWTAGHTLTGSVGLTVSHTGDSQRVYGPDPSTVPIEYYINPSNLEDLTMGATSLTAAGYSTTIDTPTAFSVNLNVVANGASSSAIRFPLCHGQSMVTGLYNNVVPRISSGTGISKLTKVTNFSKSGVTKYQIFLASGATWLLYATETVNGYGNLVPGGSLNLSLINATSIEGDDGVKFNGILQLAKLPANATADEEAIYDNASSVFCTTVDLSADVEATSANYSFSFKKWGILSAGNLTMFALPHHVASITNLKPTTLKLLSGTKGMMTAFVGNSWTLTENDLPSDISWGPWSPKNAAAPTYTSAQLDKIAAAASIEVDMDFSAKSDLDSMYYSGKELSKDALICWVVQNVLKDEALTSTCLDQVKAAFSRFSSNKQKYPLYYDNVWKGLVSSSAYVTGDTGTDFGNSLYNDHHFHYGYHVHAAAVIASMDPMWLTADNKAYVNALVRDFANPSADDPYFPVQRSFDWFSGHSWAKGLFASADGKDQESGSEDYFATYAMKMWGEAIGDKNMVARATLILAIQKRAFNTYFLLEKGNSIHPAEFEPNMVTGILFEGKVDCTTYFGNDLSFIHGIQMLPISPISPYIRKTTFVQQEWDTFFADSWTTAPWRGVLKANQAIIDPQTSYDYFYADDFDMSILDGGASLTWYLTFAAGLLDLGV